MVLVETLKDTRCLKKCRNNRITGRGAVANENSTVLLSLSMSDLRFHLDNYIQGHFTAIFLKRLHMFKPRNAYQKVLR